METGDGIPWIFIHLGWIALAGLLAYGIFRSRQMTSRERVAQQRQTRENFRVDEDSA
jgi:hypothetical protein